MKSRAHILVASSILIAQTIVAGTISNTRDVARASDQFAMDLFQQLMKRPGNFVFSPMCIDESLAVMLTGANGETARQISDVLHIPSTNVEMQAQSAHLLGNLLRSDTFANQCIIANSLWIQKGFPISESFEKNVRSNYAADLDLIDLTGWPKAFDPGEAAVARKRINCWIADKTHGKIKVILSQDIPDPTTRMILVNVVCFKGLWETPFSKLLTTNAPFYLSPSGSILAPTMQAVGPFQYSEYGGIQMLELPYVENMNGPQFSMLILLPPKTNGLVELQKSLTVQLIKHLYRTRYTRASILFVPKFRLTSWFDLKEPLRHMGIKDAFGEAADFSGISPQKPLCVQSTIHNADIDVDESGTIAASITVTQFANGIGETFENFKIDRPFLFLVRDNSNGTILFMGRVVNPLEL